MAKQGARATAEKRDEMRGGGKIVKEIEKNIEEIKWSQLNLHPQGKQV